MVSIILSGRILLIYISYLQQKSLSFGWTGFMLCDSLYLFSTLTCGSSGSSSSCCSGSASSGRVQGSYCCYIRRGEAIPAVANRVHYRSGITGRGASDERTDGAIRIVKANGMSQFMGKGKELLGIGEGAVISIKGYRVACITVKVGQGRLGNNIGSIVVSSTNGSGSRALGAYPAHHNSRAGSVPVGNGSI